MSIGHLTTDLAREHVRDLHRDAATVRRSRAARGRRLPLFTARVSILVGPVRRQMLRVHLGPADNYVAG